MCCMYIYKYMYIYIHTHTTHNTHTHTQVRVVQLQDAALTSADVVVLSTGLGVSLLSKET